MRERARESVRERERACVCVCVRRAARPRVPQSPSESPLLGSEAGRCSPRFRGGPLLTSTRHPKPSVARCRGARPNPRAPRTLGRRGTSPPAPSGARPTLEPLPPRPAARARARSPTGFGSWQGCADAGGRGRGFGRRWVEDMRTLPTKLGKPEVAARPAPRPPLRPSPIARPLQAVGRPQKLSLQAGGRHPKLSLKLKLRFGSRTRTPRQHVR